MNPTGDAANRLRGPADVRASIAVDLGAESCRVTLLRWPNGEPELTLVHRCPNGPVRDADGSLHWPFSRLLAEIEAAILRCADLAPEGIRSLAVDGWAVDYVRLDPEGKPLGEPFCYRDERTQHAAVVLHEHIAPGRMRELTGIEQQPLNTLYQLYADRLAGSISAPWLNLPEFCLYRWGAEPVAEFTNASHTQLLDLYGGNWSREIFRAAELDIRCAPRVIPPGTVLGKLSGPLSSHPGLHDVDLIAPACHDTASAIAGIAESGEDWAYISCGTWSLVGTVVQGPLNSPAVRADNFTNLGAIGGATCFHKGIVGMWLLKQCLDHWNSAAETWSLPTLLAATEGIAEPAQLLTVDDPTLLGMGNMPARINACLCNTGGLALSEDPENAPRMAALILHSLARRYADVLQRVQLHTGKRLRRIVMVGGGAQNAMLRRLTAQYTGMEVVIGPAESSTIGNLAVQLAVLEDARTPVTSPEFAPAVAGWAQKLSGASFRILTT